MSQLKTRCGSCQRKLRMMADHAGKTCACKCGAKLLCPTAWEVEAAMPTRFVCEPLLGASDEPPADDFHPADPTGSFDRDMDESLIIKSPWGPEGPPG